MEKKEVELAVIGSGPGGYVAAIYAAKLGLKTICVEKDDTLGGTCLNVGCIPSKTLLYSTEIYSLASKSAAIHGISFNGLQVDLSQMMKRKKEVVEGLVQGIRGAFKKNSVELIRGAASFIDANTIDVGGQIIKAKNFILATGSESIPLPFLSFDEKRILSSTGALSLKEIPKKMIVIGAGVIGVELASVYNRLGTEVVIVEMLDNICVGLDESISKAFLQILKKQGLTFHLGAKVVSGVSSEKGIALDVLLKDSQKPEKFEADVVLVAIGRRPFSQGLNLEKIGIEKTPKQFIQVNNRFQTRQPHIYAIGDLIEGPMLAHRASEEGIAVAKLIAGKEAKVDYLSIPNVIYTHPEVASVGLNEAQAKELNLDVLIGSCPFKANPRARCMNETEGLVKVIGERKSGRLIGMHILGANASEMIGEGVIAIEKKATLEEIATTSHAHPTLSEAIMEATQNALGLAIHL